jgi:hypothetical protein
MTWILSGGGKRVLFPTEALFLLCLEENRFSLWTGTLLRLREGFSVYEGKIPKAGKFVEGKFTKALKTLTEVKSCGKRSCSIWQQSVPFAHQKHVFRSPSF